MSCTVKLASKFSVSVSVIARYERDERTLSIGAAKKLADLLDTTIGALLGENKEVIIFKGPKFLERFKAIKAFSKDDSEKIYLTLMQ